jgi:trimeric autotransporter adhesin
MLGFSPLASAPLGDNGDQRLEPLVGAAAGGITIEGTSFKAIARTTVHTTSAIALAGAAKTMGRIDAGGLNKHGLALAGSATGVARARLGAQLNVYTQGQTAGQIASQAGAASTFDVSTKADADLRLDGAGARTFGVSGLAIGRSEAALNAVGVIDLTGAAGAGTENGVDIQIAVALFGKAAGGLTCQAQAARVFDIRGVVDAAALLDSAAASGIGLTGSAATHVVARTAVGVITLFGGEVRGTVATHGVTEATAVVQGVAAVQTGITAAANFTVTLIGRSSVSSLSPLFGQAIAGISITSLARADASASATAASEVGLGATAMGVVPLRSALQGAVDIAGPSETGVAILGQSGRSIAIFGAATSAVGVGSEVTGALAVQGHATIVAHRTGLSAGTVQLFGATSLRGAVSGAGGAVFDTALQADGAVPLPAVAGSLLVLDAIAHAVAASGGTGSSSLSLSGQSAAVVTATVQTGGTVALTLDAAGAVVSAGTARSTIDVLRAVIGGAAVTGDAARQIGIGGHAVGEIALNGWALEGALDLSAAMTASASASVSAQGELGFAGGAVVALDIGAGAKPGLDIAMTTAAVVGLSMTATPAVLFGGAAGIQVAARGSAQSAHGIEIATTCATAAAGRAGGALVLDLRGTAQSGVSGSGTGAMEITRAALGTVPVTAQAARSMPLLGLGVGSAANAGKATLARLRVELTTAAQTRTRAEAAVASAVDGSGAARALTTGAARIDLGVTKLGLGFVVVAGAAVRHISFAGDVGVRVDAVAGANANVVPRLQSTASNIIAIAFTGQAQMPQAVSAASTITTCRSPTGLLEARGTGIGYRAPPALRRSEWPNTRQGGNLAPSLRSGRIVQG